MRKSPSRPPWPFPAPFDGSYSKEFFKCYAQAPVPHLFELYKRRGGNLDLLARILWQLHADPKTYAPPPQLKAKLKRCERALSDLLGIESGNPELDRLLGQPLLFSVLRGSHKGIQAAIQTLHSRRRLPGLVTLSRDSLVVALLDHEFRRVFGRPRRRLIGRILRIFASDRFNGRYVSTEHLRQRSLSINRALIEQCRTKLLHTLPLSVSPRP